MDILIFSSDSDSENEVLLATFSDWDTSNDENDDPRKRRRRASRNLKRVNYMITLDDAKFTFRFRLSKTAVDLLLSKLMPLIRVTSTRNHGVSPLHQVLLTLRFYALGTMLISVADFVGVSKATAGRIVKDISSAIANLYDEYVVIHQQAADKFYQIAGFPRVLAAIDCHIVGEEFKNGKGYFSLNIQAMCDADLKLMNVVARWPGSAHDATIFNNSVLKGQCEAGQFGNRWLLGDSAYPNTQYLLTPLLNPVTVPEHRYEAHIKTKNKIERTFGVWKRGFPVLALTMRLLLPTVQAVIIATAVLHNICRNLNMNEVPVEVEELPLDSIDDYHINNDQSSSSVVFKRSTLSKD